MLGAARLRQVLAGRVPAAPTTVTIGGLDDGIAAAVDFFSLQVGGTLIQERPFAFASATNGLGLAAAIGALSPLITASYSMRRPTSSV